MTPSRASISRTRWPLPIPPMAGLQDISPIVAARWVTSAVAAPQRAAAAAASQPACPPPITMTSKPVIARPCVFHVKQVLALHFADAEPARISGPARPPPRSARPPAPSPRPRCETAPPPARPRSRPPPGSAPARASRSRTPPDAAPASAPPARRTPSLRPRDRRSRREGRRSPRRSSPISQIRAAVRRAPACRRLRGRDLVRTISVGPIADASPSSAARRRATSVRSASLGPLPRPPDALPARPDRPCPEFPRYRPGSPDSRGDRSPTSIGSRVVPAKGEVIATSRPGDRVHQRRLADVRRAGDHHDEAGPQPLGRLRARERPVDPRDRAAAPPRGPTPPSGPPRPRRRKSRVAPRPSPSRREAAREWRRTPACSAPPAIRCACRRCASVSASTRSASPSASDRSILPFRNARQANSPGSASRNPGDTAKRPRQRRRDGPTAGHVHLGDLLAGKAPRRREPDHQRAVERRARRPDPSASARRAVRSGKDGARARAPRGPPRNSGPETRKTATAAFPDAARLGENRVLFVGEQSAARPPDRAAAARDARRAISRAACRRRTGRRSPRGRPASRAGNRDSRC